MSHLDNEPQHPVNAYVRGVHVLYLEILKANLYLYSNLSQFQLALTQAPTGGTLCGIMSKPAHINKMISIIV